MLCPSMDEYKDEDHCCFGSGSQDYLPHIFSQKNINLLIILILLLKRNKIVPVDLGFIVFNKGYLSKFNQIFLMN